METYTINNFNNEFPDNDKCLEWLINYKYPNGIICNNTKCKKYNTVTPHHKIKNRMCYSCDYYGHHIYPMANTIFQDSTTQLKYWFHAVYIMSSTRCGISAKQIQRETGVTYKTAWRMFKQEQTRLGEDIERLEGSEDVEENYLG